MFCLSSFHNCSVHNDLTICLQSSRGSQAFSFPKMGNTNTVKKHVETAEKTGACQLAKLGLAEVRTNILFFLPRSTTAPEDFLEM